ELVVSKADTRYVKGKHHAGGWSQQRFARGREKQMRELFDEACEVARDRLAPYERRLDYIYLGGERLTLLAFRKRCPYLEKLADKIAPRILEVERPNRGALEGIPREVWKCRVTLVRRA
ncbi:MAG: Vms1/Ankzf1 family peptidyl-tRNA hydrolase, partial [Chloroflexota bacterium]